MKVFAVIVTYNGMRWIDRCLGSLKASTVPIHVIVIDNQSTDGTRQYLPAHYPDAIWMPQDQNLGFGAANNLGIRYAMEHGADFVLLLNQDAWVDADAVELMTRQSDGISLLSPVHFNGDGSRLDYFFDIGLRNKANGLYYDALMHKPLADSYEISEVCAACWLLPAALIKKIGLFNPLFYHYSEDNNYYHRMLYHGVGILLVPQARMYHDREIYGNIAAYNKKRLRRDIVLGLTNINKPLLLCWAKCFSLLVKCYFVELPRHTYTIGAFSLNMLWALFHLPKILRSRRKDKEDGSWL